MSKKMSKEDKEDWAKLYNYVKKDIMNYKENMKLSSYMILRLRGLQEGKFMANKNTKSLGEYTFNQILITFKICKTKIDKALWNKTKFKDEQHIINTIMLIIERNINDVVLRMNLAEANKYKLEKIEDEISKPSEMSYVKNKNNKNKVKNILKDIL